MAVQLCGAKTRKGFCTRPVMKGRNRCYHHGGATPTGPALPQFKHGKYSRYFPAGLAERYREALPHSPLSRIRHELAATEARLSELFSRLSDSSALAQQWETAYVAVETALQDGANVQQALEQLKTVTQQGLVSEETWKEAYGLMELRRRQMETEGKLTVMSSTSLSAEQAMAMVATITHVLTKHVLDKTILAAIGNELRQLLSMPKGVDGPTALPPPGAET